MAMPSTKSMTRHTHSSISSKHPLLASRRQVLSIARASTSSEPVTTTVKMVEVFASTLSSASPQSFQVESGEILRTALLANKVDLYNTWGKVMNCGGGGSCGTCIVEVLEGSGVLSERTPGEEKKLKGKPASWRLACQALVGDGECDGKVSVKTQPKA